MTTANVMALDSPRTVYALGGVMIAGLVGLSCFVGLEYAHHILFVYGLVFLGLFLTNKKTKWLCGFFLFLCLANWCMFDAITYAPDAKTLEEQKLKRLELQQKLERQIEETEEKNTTASGDAVPGS